LTISQSIATQPPVTTAQTASSNSPAKTNSVKADAGVASNPSVTPVAGQPVNVGSLLEKAMQKISPTYPAFAKTAHVSGIVRVDLVIDEKGAVVSAQSNTGPAVLRQAAVDAARRWKFRPTMSDGQPVRAAGFLNFNFTPQ
jgi:protein TonB